MVRQAHHERRGRLTTNGGGWPRTEGAGHERRGSARAPQTLASPLALSLSKGKVLPLRTRLGTGANPVSEQALRGSTSSPRTAEEAHHERRGVQGRHKPLASPLALSLSKGKALPLRTRLGTGANPVSEQALRGSTSSPRTAEEAHHERRGVQGRHKPLASPLALSLSKGKALPLRTRLGTGANPVSEQALRGSTSSPRTKGGLTTNGGGGSPGAAEVGRQRRTRPLVLSCPALSWPSLSAVECVEGGSATPAWEAF